MLPLDRERMRLRLWNVLFRNVSSAVDELYYMCEAEGSVEHCEEASKVLESCSRDFRKLIERSQVQSEYEAEPAPLEPEVAGRGVDQLQIRPGVHEQVLELQRWVKVVHLRRVRDQISWPQFNECR